MAKLSSPEGKLYYLSTGWPNARVLVMLKIYILLNHVYKCNAFIISLITNLELIITTK